LDFSATIINWYNLYHRKLPWRETKNPYYIWLSEVILQQTKVEQGLPYFFKFTQQFPTIQALASANEDFVLKLWQGLGYYSRARNLLTTAKEIVKHHGSEFPASFEGLKSLKGIGDYTAAAIASFAYNLPYPVVDGNVFRILSRYLGIYEPVPKSRRIFTEAAKELMGNSSPERFNQAIMELGAMVCMPRNPNCSSCPLAPGCFALQQAEIKNLPAKAKKAEKKDRHIFYFFIQDKENTYLRKRIENDIWKNLYDLPFLEYSNKIEENKALEDFLIKFKLQGATVIGPPKKLKHLLTHQNIYATFFHLRGSLNKKGQDFIEVAPIKALGTFPVSRLLENYFASTLKNT
jgi:A/G-specific adenine glycosylase